MKPLISIIVPVYNLEKLICKCVESLLAQTYKNIEIILVNDGSKDTSPAICDKYAAADNRVKVIHKANAGVSEARNSGLDAMNGEYVTFIDGDDFVTEDLIECLYKVTADNNADISTCAHFRLEFDGTIKYVNPMDTETEATIINNGENAVADMFYGKSCSASSWGKLYKKEIFSELRFPDYVMGEDTYVAYHAFRKATTVAHTNRPLYYYVQHTASVTNNKANYYKFYDYIRLYDHIISCETNNKNEKYMLSVYNRLIENNFWVYMKLRNCPNMFIQEKKHIEDNIKKYRKYVINNPLSEMRVRLACLVSLGGMNALNIVYDKVMK